IGRGVLSHRPCRRGAYVVSGGGLSAAASLPHLRLGMNRPALLTLVLLLRAPAIEAQSIRIQVVDVGQADGTLIRTPHMKWVLVDAGQEAMLADSLGPYFGVSRLALAIGSHRHHDHIGGMDVVLRKIPTD